MTVRRFVMEARDESEAAAKWAEFWRTSTQPPEPEPEPEPAVPPEPAR